MITSSSVASEYLSRGRCEVKRLEDAGGALAG